jgi:BirA family transcriptional regulator, biotin operon repressor / biotin---[acetyl-CoA-carboxylase] ligase
MSEPLPAEIAAALGRTADRRRHLGEPSYFFSETASTNDVAAELAERGAPEGTTVVASAQTAGRGRFGRDWFSPPGAGLYASVVFRNPKAVPLLTLAGGVAVADGVHAATALPVRLKWPNDVVVETGVTGVRWRKLAGVLAEASTGVHGLHHAVLGFGVNLRPAAYPADIADRATSIETELGRVPDAGAVLAETLCVLAAYAEAVHAGDARPLLDRWRALAPSARGATVRWDTSNGEMTGVTAGIDDSGALLVRAGNRVERIISGELRWM